MSAFNYVLFDLCGDLHQNEFHDTANKTAYTVRLVSPAGSATNSIEIRRQANWGYALEHEPWTAVLSFQQPNTLGRVDIGQKSSSMSDLLRKKSSINGKARHFTGMDGREYRWGPASRRLECYDKNDGLIAVYEYLMDDTYYAKLEIKPEGWSMTTEIVATLILNRFAIRYGL